MKKVGKILRNTLLTLILLLVTLWLLIQTSPVQNWLVGQVTNKLSRDLKSRISIRNVEFSFFNKMVLQGVMMKDRKGDTLLYAGQVRLNITDWFFFKDKIELKYVGLDDAYLRIARTDTVWNYSFLADYFSGGKSATQKPVDLQLGRIRVTKLHLLKEDAWRGEDMELRLAAMDFDADSMDFANKKAYIHSIIFTEPDFAIRNYTGNRPGPPPDTNEIIHNDPLHLRWNPDNWDMHIAHVVIDNGSFRDDKVSDHNLSAIFDDRHIHFENIAGDFKDVAFVKDSITARIVLSTRERSGLHVKNLTADMKFHPEGMEFHNLDLQTDKSHLRNFFAMRFRSFDDLSDYNTKVTMESNFVDATVDSDDIAFFASELKTWKKSISLTGKIKGPVADLQGSNLRIRAGQHTMLYGDIRMTGLPDIDKTIINFKSNDFQTTYQDVITFVPSLKNIQQPHIDQIRQLHFTGNFFGTINNFTTSGTITTNIGSMVTNLSMQFPSRGPTVYSGTLLTNDLELGKLMGDSSLGAISFRGRVSGSGLAMNTANAVLDGNIREMNYLGYRYTDIFVNGQATKKRFNGTIISKDSNLLATLNGLIDFSGPTPKFDFDASIDNADLRTLHFVKDSLIFNGKLRFNFSGNDIDHFLGKARIYDATLIKKGERLSFDSLVVASDIIDSSKTITVMSNEFEGAIVGEFSIQELPAAFQEFLHRYYPSYIKPNTQKLSAEKFSFVITTRNVDPYLDLFDKNISGFNMTNITGRINSTENLLNLNASIPEFSYKSINFYKVDLRANGNFDSLSADTRIAEVYINDSLHFPSTHIHVRSFNDLSDVQFTTSANQTLNAANVSAQVQTLSDGARIKFNPSTFDINSKTWTIDKNGELSFSKNIVGANALRIYSGQQQILVSTHPSGEGNWNDVHIEIQKVNIGDFTPFFVPDERIEGLLTGTADITDPFNHTDLSFNGHAEEFRFSNDSIGKLTLEADYNKQSSIVNTRVHSDNMDYHFDLTGVINTADSATQPINIMVPNIVNTRIDLLQKYLDGVFSNVTGYATGQLQIAGTGHDLNYIGDLQLKSGSLHVNYTQCTYKIPNATVHLRADRIDFGSFQVTDSLGNKAEVSKSVIYHHSWRDMRYDFVINTNKLLLLNTTIADNNQFYGTMIGSANVRLTGPQEDLQMYIKGAPTDSSNIFIPTTTSRESADADFIVWKVYGKEMKPQRMLSGQENFTVNVDVTANNYANIYLIIDPLTRDIIKATGHGNLQLQVGTNTNMNMRGKYEIDRGNYNFSFQSFIRKPFVFMEGADNYIQWTGDPYNADINIQAVYSAENVQFADLDLSDKILQGSDKLRSYHGTVWVIANLTDKLMHPAITFDIQLPPNSELRNDFYTTALLNQYIVADPNELNKQVAFLLVFNSFGPLSLTGSAISANEAVGGIFFNSISGFISSALSTRFSSIFQNVFKDKSIRVNFNTSFYNGMGLSDATDRTYDRTNLNMSVIKSFLNERLTFTVGSALDFGLTEQQMQYAAVQFLPNVTAEWKITQNGRIVLTFFYRDSYNYLNVNNHATNSSGTSISYRRDFDRVDEIFGKKKKTVTDSAEVKSSK